MEEKSNKYKIIFIIIIVILLALIAVLGYKIYSDEKNTIIEPKEKENYITNDVAQEEPEKKEISIFKGNDRPIAVMIDNHSGAWPQSGLNKTYIVYEIIVKGGETRLMALFKGQDLKEIGPIRSSRHYFLDYAIENDAIYVHYGWSPKAKNDISSLKVNNLNGIFYGKPTFWRTTSKKAPHNAMTSTKQILKAAKAKKYKTTSKKSSVLNYVPDEVNLENGKEAKNIKIPYSYLHTVSYKYDKKTQRYTRYARGKKQIDNLTGKDITTKNIIIEFVKNSVLQDGTKKDRQNLSNIGTFDGYFITNGKAIKIKCTKKNRTSKTEYKDLNGNIINVNDGNTWINICPKNAKVKIGK